MLETKEYLMLKNEYYKTSFDKVFHVEYDDKKDILEKIKEHNKELVKRYPFLKPYNVMTGKEIEDYDYSHTWLDDLEDGWRIAFGKELIEELRNELIKFPYKPEDNWNEPEVCENDTWLNHYKITQIKEKWGELRWYDAGIPKGGKRFNIDIIGEGTLTLGQDKDEECKVWDIIDKYSAMSRTICFKCGKPAKYLSIGWICPWCEDCANNYIEKENKYLEEKNIDFRHVFHEEFRPIEECLEEC